MKPKPPAYKLEAGRLRPPPDVTTGTRSLELIDSFIDKYASNDLISWSKENTRTRSGLVLHPQDRTLRIDLQPPPPGWANFQLQAGEDSLACVLLECDRTYRAADVKEAWLASLKETRNARMKWRYLPSAIELHVLNGLDAWQARDVSAIVSVLRQQGSGMVLDFHLPYMEVQITRALKVLEDNGLTRRQAEGWVLTRDGIEYT